MSDSYPDRAVQRDGRLSDVLDRIRPGEWAWIRRDWDGTLEASIEALTTLLRDLASDPGREQATDTPDDEESAPCR